MEKLKIHSMRILPEFTDLPDIFHTMEIYNHIMKIKIHILLFNKHPYINFKTINFHFLVVSCKQSSFTVYSFASQPI